MQDTDLQVLPGPPHAFLKRRLLEELLHNPFLDEDAPALALRLSIPEAEVRQAISGLLQSRFMRNAPGRGFMLDLELSGPNADGGTLTVQDDEPAVEIGCDLDGEGWEMDLEVVSTEFQSAQDLPATDDVELVPQPIDLQQAPHENFSSDQVGIEELVQALPFGVLTLGSHGNLEIGNKLAANWLGVPIDNLDAATFELVTRVNPMPVASGSAPFTFSVTRPRALEISLYPCTTSSGEGVLIVVRDASLQEEISRLQRDVQEELFGLMQDGMVSPLHMIERFLNRPDEEGLVQARTAMEQINSFLTLYFLRESGDGNK